LPDLLASPNLVQGSERERLAEALDRQARLIAGLGKWKGAAFSLRYLARPERGEIEIAILGRVLGRAGQGQRQAEEAAADVATLLRSFEFAPQAVASAADLTGLIEPFADPAVVGLRQREAVVSLRAGDAYAVFPFRPPASSWLPVMETLLRQRTPCLLEIALGPTLLTRSEQQSFSEAAAFAEQLADFTYRGLSGEYRLPDPQARLVARLYTDYLQRLTDPFLLTVQIVGPDPAALRSVAQTLGAEITVTVEAAAGRGQGDGPLPAGFEIVTPRHGEDLAAARHNLRAMDFHPWGAGKASPGKERLALLADAATAAAAFRFPVALRGGIPGVRAQQAAPSYDVGPRRAQAGPGEIALGEFTGRGGVAAAPLAIFARHTLVAGTNGSGKTTTCQHILSELWAKGIPFLVIEPAKTEYRTLLRSSFGAELRVFTLGDESVSPFRLNPLELLPGVRVEAHIGAVRACLEAALPSFGVLPLLIEESLHAVYQQNGWELTDRGRTDDNRPMPTLGDLYFEIIRAAEQKGWSDKTLQDIRAAAAGRIGSLLRGSKGRMLNTRRSLPFADIMTRPTVLELEALNDDEKALVMLFLLTHLREYCRTTRQSSALQHVTLIEEAHRVMEATPHAGNREISADTRAAAVGMVSATLSEIRASGEGLIIAEQIPGRLAEDALKNTNLKIIHRLPGRDDREAVGGAMNLSQEQQDFVGKLAPGQAALSLPDFERPAFISVPNVRHSQGLPERVSDDAVEEHMAAYREARKAESLPFAGCAFCRRVCSYRDRVGPAAYELSSGNRWQAALAAFALAQDEDKDAGWNELAEAARRGLRPLGLAADEHALYCYFAHVWNYALPGSAAGQ
ncbi:MAG: DUF87 domain-containing protein, partial [Chloroflexi bacterium]|nr:DUF87 domain-containing protein [Chloroflexota bacterium]